MPTGFFSSRRNAVGAWMRGRIRRGGAMKRRSILATSSAVLVALATIGPTVNGHLKVPTCGHEKSPPSGTAQGSAVGPPPLALASFMR